MEDSELVIRFSYHPPQPGQPERYERIRAEALDLARTINGVTPDSREKSMAMSALDEVVMYANAAIARRELTFEAPADE